MRSAQRGGSTSPVEVTHISEHGIWLLFDGRELFMAFEHFPWFRAASIAAVMNVDLEGPGHLYFESFYQTLINTALREYIAHRTEPLEKVLRRVLREELKKAS